MNKLTSISFIATILFFTSSCASIVSKSSYPLTVNTAPSGVNIAIQDDSNVTIFSGSSPATVSLDASRGFFKKARYFVIVSGEGYQGQTVPVTFKVDGWYWGNLLFGGIIGMLIVDPATGAMYKLKDEYINITLQEDTTSTDIPSLQIKTIDELTITEKQHLVKIRP